MSKPLPAGNVPQPKKSVSKASAAKGRGDSQAVQAKRHKEDRSTSARDNSGRLEKVYQERKRRVGRLHKITQLSAKK